jgi:RNA polymerase sigma-70 factor (ECF subfamily)
MSARSSPSNEYPENAEARRSLEVAYRLHSRQMLATLIRLLGGFDLAEEAMHDAFVAAAQQWPRDGVPANPRAWLISAGRFRAIDRLRKKARLDAVQDELSRHLEFAAQSEDTAGPDDFQDDRLRLIFICCHPSLPIDAQIAMTLREVCGLTTEQIAHAFLTTPPTIAQRIVRAKARIRDQAIAYEIPAAADRQARIESVLRVIYLIFTEGYADPGPDGAARELCDEAIRLGRLVRDLFQDSETTGLLALMLLQHSRRAARLSGDRELRLLYEQDQRLWDQSLIEEGCALAAEALSNSVIGSYALQAAIAAVHAKATGSDTTDWKRIVAYYDLLLRAEPSPVVELNRAVAVAKRDGAAAGLHLIEGLLARGELRHYHPAYAALAHLYEELGRTADAIAALETGIHIVRHPPERRWFEQQLARLRSSGRNQG